MDISPRISFPCFILSPIFFGSFGQPPKRPPRLGKEMRMQRKSFAVTEAAVEWPTKIQRVFAEFS